MSERKTISEVAKTTSLPAKTIRYYEEIGLVVATRSANGYRTYGAPEIHKLKFIQRARSLGFSIDNCRTLLSLYEDQNRASKDVKQVAEEHLREIDEKIQELQNLREVLTHLVEHCAGDARPDCPIIDDLAAPVAEEIRPRVKIH